MSDTTGKGTHPSASLPSGVRPDEEVCARALKPVRALRQLLDDERKALTVAEPRALVTLAERKTHLLDALEALQPALGEALLRTPEEDATRREIIDCLEACRASNAENGVTTATVANHVRSTLMLLRGTLALDDLTLYDDNGELLNRRERRPLGSA